MSYFKVNIMISIIATLIFSCEKNQVVEPIVKPIAEYQPGVSVVNKNNVFSVTAYVRDTSFIIGEYLNFQSDSILYDFVVENYSSGSMNVFLDGKFHRYWLDYVRKDHISSDTSIQEIRCVGCKPYSVGMVFYNFCGKLSVKINAMPTNLFHRLHGNWNWIPSFGGNNADNSTLETKVYTFNSADSSFVCYHADTVFYSGYYSIDEVNWTLQIGNTYFNDGNRHLICYLNHDTLYSRWIATDVATQLFVKIP